jgi:hypothetical protein
MFVDSSQGIIMSKPKYCHIFRLKIINCCVVWMYKIYQKSRLRLASNHIKSPAFKELSYLSSHLQRDIGINMK